MALGFLAVVALGPTAQAEQPDALTQAIATFEASDPELAAKVRGARVGKRNRLCNKRLFWLDPTAVERLMGCYAIGLEGSPHDTLASLDVLSRLYRAQGRNQLLEPVELTELGLAEQAYGIESEAWVRIAHRRALRLSDEHRLREAEALFREVIRARAAHAGRARDGGVRASMVLDQPYLRAREARLDPNDPALADALWDLAVVRRQRGDFIEARDLLRRVVAIERNLGETFRLNGALRDYALTYQFLGQMNAAEPLYLEAIAIVEGLVGGEHPDAWVAKADYAYFLVEDGRPAEAHDLLVGHPHGHDDPMAMWAFARAEAAWASKVPADGEWVLRPDHADQVVRLYEAALNGAEQDNPFRDMVEADAALFLAGVGRADQANEYLRAALTSGGTSELAQIRWTVLDAASQVAAADGRTGEAILYGKQAVNELQTMRTTLDTAGLGAGFLAHHEGTYRRLFALLAGEGRLAEAEQVLRMLKEEEYHQFLRRSSDAAGTQRASFDAREAPLAERLVSVGLEALQTTDELAQLNAIEPFSRTDAEKSRLRALEQSQVESQEAFMAAVADIGTTLKEDTTTPEPPNYKQLGKLKDTLSLLDGRPLLVHTVLAPDALHLLIITPDGQAHERVEVSREELRLMISAFRVTIQNEGDVLPLAQQLYDWIIRPVEPHLAAAQAETLMLSLDDSLRYMPLAALHDGDQWLVEKWPLAIFVPAAVQNPGKPKVGEPQVVGFGVSEPSAVGEHRFSALPGVPEELDAIVRLEGEDPAGVVPGRVYLDERFTGETLKYGLAGDASWVHLASHFHFGTTDTDSFLVLGDGEHLTLEELRKFNYKFQGVELLTLSACETAMGTGRLRGGAEVEGFAVLAQNNGARNIVATLWPVADASTATWMSSLYTRMADDELGKAQAVRAVQMAFISGAIEATDETARRGSFERLDNAESEELPPELQGWRHPFYWAPFVLMGNWQ